MALGFDRRGFGERLDATSNYQDLSIPKPEINAAATSLPSTNPFLGGSKGTFKN